MSSKTRHILSLSGGKDSTVGPKYWPEATFTVARAPASLMFDPCR